MKGSKHQMIAGTCISLMAMHSYIDFPLPGLCRINLKSVLYNEAVCQVNTLMTLLNGALLPAVNSNTILSAGHYEKYVFCLFYAVGCLFACPV